MQYVLPVNVAFADVEMPCLIGKSRINMLKSEEERNTDYTYPVIGDSVVDSLSSSL